MNIENTLLVILAALILLTFGSAAIIGRTAKSKGYSYGLFFFLGIVSYLLTAVVTIFLRPKGQPHAKPKVSALALLALGVLIEFVGIGYIPDTALTGSSSDAALSALFADTQFVGGVAIAFAGLLLVIGAVASDYRHGAQEEIRQF